MSKLVYLSGPMSGLPQFNYPAFAAATADLRARGYTVIAPHELDPPQIRDEANRNMDGVHLTSREYAMCIGQDITEILSGIDGIVVLPDWGISRGAAIETFAGYRILGAPVWNYGPTDPLQEVSALDLERVHLAIRG